MQYYHRHGIIYELNFLLRLEQTYAVNKNVIFFFLLLLMTQSTLSHYLAGFRTIFKGKDSTLQEQTHQDLKEGYAISKSQFIFGPQSSILSQIAEFRQFLKDELWDGQVVFLGFKGSFKMEYWSIFEEASRSVVGLNKISFVDTNLDLQHLKLLRSLAQWINPEEISFEFIQNELDDYDFEDVLIRKMLPALGRKIKSLIMVSNPGIFKGHFVSNLKRKLAEMTEADSQYDFKFVKNKESKSIGFIRILRNQSAEVVEEQISLLKTSIEPTFFFKLSLKNCFNETNHEAFKYLIEQTYHEDKLEQLESLDVSWCDLGPENEFQNLCQMLSSSKGLLSLGMSRQVHLQQLQVWQRLMGDRYDQLRLNHIDISSIGFMDGECFNIISEKLMSISLKSIDMSGSLEQVSTIYMNIIFIAQAFMKQIKVIQRKMEKEKLRFIPKLTLKKLDLSAVDNNDYDLISTMIFNEFSACKEFIIQKLDIYTTHSYLVALDYFERHIKKMKETNHLYKKFVPKIESIEMHFQNKMSLGSHEKIFERIFFTKFTDLLQIRKVILKDKCLLDPNNKKCFLVFLKSIVTEMKYTLQDFTMSESSVDDIEVFDLLFKNIIFSENFKLESLTLKQETFGSELGKIFITYTENFIHSIDQGSLWSLKILILENIRKTKIDVMKLVDLMVFSGKVELKELRLLNLDIFYDEKSMISLKQNADGWRNEITIKNLHLGGFKNDYKNSESILFEVLIIHPKSRIIELLLKTPKIVKQLLKFKEITDKNSHEIQISLGQLKSLILEGESIDEETDPEDNEEIDTKTLDNIEKYTANEWELFGQIFIYGKDININSIEFRHLIITSELALGLHNCLAAKKQKEKQHQNSSDNLQGNSLNTLIFVDCTFKAEIFSLLFSRIKSDSQILHIIECQGLDDVIKEFQKTFNNHIDQDKFNLAISDLNIEGTNFSDLRLFEWFFGEIILNKERQQLRSLCLKQRYTDQHFKIINDLLKQMKAFHFADNIKHRGYFRLRQLNFDGNSVVSYESWKDLFYNLFTLHDDKEIDIEQQSIELNKEIVAQKKIDSKDLECEKIALFVADKKFSIPQNMHINSNLYTITPPTQLNRLQFSLEFFGEEPQIKQKLYDSIFSGLVFYDGSQLKELCLTFVDLSMMLNSSEISLKTTNQVPLKKLDLDIYSQQTADQLNKLAMLCISNPQLDLEVLIVRTQYATGNFYKNVADNIEAALRDRKKCSLHTIRLTNVSCDLDVQQTLHFFQTVVFNRSVPLKVLEIGTQAIMHSDENLFQSLKTHITEPKYSCPLQNFTVTITSEHTLITLSYLLPLLLQGDQVKLDKFCFKNYTKITPQLIQKLDDREMFSHFTITDLTLDYDMEMSLEEFKFFYYVRPILKVLNLGQLSTKFNSQKEIDLFLDAQVGSKTRFIEQNLCKLKLKFVHNTGNGGQLMKKFVFGKSFQWTDVSMIGFEHINFIENLEYTQLGVKHHLRYLNINLNLKEGSNYQMNNNSLKMIGNQLIYNEDSLLEELSLIGCHLDTPGIECLTSGASAFRDRIQKSNSQKMTQLSLRRLNLCQSPLEEGGNGALLISRDIIFFEYITIERIELQDLDWDSNMSIQLCQQGLNWIKFQSQIHRKKPVFQLKYADWGRSKYLITKKAWQLLCETFLFSDNAPYLKVLNMHDMNLKDSQIDWICQKVDDYFENKSRNFVHPLKRLNFSNNPAISVKGWEKISQKIFFSRHINLEELNLTDNLIDSQTKLSSIFKAGTKKLTDNKIQKLTLHTLIIKSIELKQLFAGMMSHRPEDYLAIQDQPIEIEQCHIRGDQSGNPDSFGQQIKCFNTSVYKADHIINQNWKEETMRFSKLHLDISNGFLRPLNKFLTSESGSKKSGYFPIDLTTCDELCTLFKYNQDTGSPYPYQIFFSPEAIKFYMEPSCNIRVINFIETNIKNSEQMDQFEIFELWKLVKSSKTSLDIVYIDYKLTDDLVEAMIAQGYSERDIVTLVRMFPPSRIRLCDTLSLQALKGIYSIMWDNHQFSYADIIYDKHVFLNVGIGYSLREWVYRFHPTSCLGRSVKSIFYHMFNVFVSDVKTYAFEDKIKELNDLLSTYRRYFILLTILTIIYYIICIFGSYFWQHYQVGDADFDFICINGVTNDGIYNYLVFAVFSFIAEAFLYYRVSQKIPNLIKGLINIDEEVKQDQVALSKRKIHPQLIKSKDSHSNFSIDLPKEEEVGMIQQIESESKEKYNKVVSNLKTMTNVLSSDLNNFAKSKSGRILGYIKDLSLGQLVKFNLYTNINFIVTCYYCQYNILAILALIVSALSVAKQLYALINFILTQISQSESQAKLLSTQYINDFFEISVIGRHVALSNILDVVAPYNVTIIPNNFITRAVVPLIAGKSISNSVKGYILKFVFEDVPLILIQLYFVVYSALDINGKLSPSIYIAIINTGVSLILSFIQFMSIRPSTISLADFDALALKKTLVFMEGQINFINQEKKILEGMTLNE